MAQHRWRDRPEVVARMIDSGSVHSWSARDIVLKPNETCVILADGKVQDILSETVLKNYVGGFTRWLGSKVGLGSSDHKLIFAMTGPFDMLIPMEGQAGDGAVVNGALHIRIQIQRDDVPKLINIFANHGRELDRAFFENLYADEIMTRVARPLLSRQADPTVVRSTDFQDALEMAMRAEMRASFDQYGMTMLKVHAVLDQTDLEKLAAYRAQTETMMARADVVSEAALAAIDRQRSTTIARIEAEASVAKAKARGEVEAQLEHELLELRKQEAAWEAERTDMAARQEIEITGEQARMDIAMGAFEQVQAAKRARLAQQADANLNRQQHTDGVQAEMMKMAAEHGALTPEVMQTFLEQQSTQKAHDQPITASGNPAPTPAAAAPAAAPAAPVTPTCAGCGGEVQTAWKACPQCGTPR